MINFVASELKCLYTLLKTKTHVERAITKDLPSLKAGYIWHIGFYSIQDPLLFTAYGHLLHNSFWGCEIALFFPKIQMLCLGMISWHLIIRKEGKVLNKIILLHCFGKTKSQISEWHLFIQLMDSRRTGHTDLDFINKVFNTVLQSSA